MSTKTETGPLHLLGLRIRDFRGIDCVDLQLDPRGLTVIAGDNGQGKTSTLAAIEAALGVGERTGADVRSGREAAEIELDLGGLTVRRRIVRREDGTEQSQLTVRSADGTKLAKPQQLLDSLLNAVAVDPTEWLVLGRSGAPGRREAARRLLAACGSAAVPNDLVSVAERSGLVPDAAKLDLLTFVERAGAALAEIRRTETANRKEIEGQIAALRTRVEDLIGLDWEEAGGLDGAESRAADARRALAKATAAQAGAAEELRSATAEAEKAIQARQQVEAKIAAAERDCEHLARRRDLMAAQVEQLRASLERQERELADAAEEAHVASDRVMELKRSAASLEFDESLVKADKAKAAAAAAKNGLELAAETVKVCERAASLSLELAAQSRKLADVEARLDSAVSVKRAAENALGSALPKSLPVKGLRLTPDGLELDGRPFPSNACSSEGLLVAARVAMGAGGKLRLLRYDDANRLSSENLARLARMAHDADWQVLVVMVSEDETLDGAIVIQDGRVAADNRAQEI